MASFYTIQSMRVKKPRLIPHIGPPMIVAQARLLNEFIKSLERDITRAEYIYVKEGPRCRPSLHNMNHVPSGLIHSARGSIGRILPNPWRVPFQVELHSLFYDSELAEASAVNFINHYAYFHCHCDRGTACELDDVKECIYTYNRRNFYKVLIQSFE